MHARLLLWLSTASLVALLARAAAADEPQRARARPTLLDWVPDAGPRTRAGSNVVFLNNCIATNGCMLLPGRSTGQNDSRTNTTSILTQPALLEKWKFGAAQWDDLAACVRDVFSPFGLTIVTEEPAATTEYFEAMIAGRASQIGLDGDFAGVAPFSCGVIDNAITFTFANEHETYNPTSAGDLCWTAAQEIAHAFGLQHKYDSRDPMTYLEPTLPIKLFVDADGPCGTLAARNCAQGDQYEPAGCPGAPPMTNSYRKIAALFGTKPATPPALTVTEPAAEATVSRGFVVRATAGDDVRLRDVAVILDGVTLSPVLRTGPFEWRTPKTTPEGAHTLKVVATDYYGASTEVTRSVATRPDCSGNAAGCDAGDVCIEGRCVVGPGRDGGLGRGCDSNAECASGLCAARNGDRVCVEECTLGQGACPSGFSCLATTDASVCWPIDEQSCNGGGDASAPAALALGLFSLLAARRRPRKP